MKIISIVCQKGGVGKTTSVVNISSLLANKGFKVLIIDLDPQGNVSTYLDKSKDGINYTISSDCLLYTSPSPRDKRQSRMPSSA